MYIYESHLGGLFASEDRIGLDDLYCEQCGGYDLEIGEVSTRAEARALLDGRDYSRGAVREILDGQFGRGVYRCVKAFRHVAVWQDDSEYFVADCAWDGCFDSPREKTDSGRRRQSSSLAA